MDLLEKFSSVEIKPTDCMTEADRQFCQRQQEAYQDAVTGFYQIGGLLSDMYRQQKAVLFDPEDRKDAWREKYLVSSWWREIDVNYLLKHIFILHTEFIDTLVSYLNAAYHLSISSFSVAAGLLPKEPARICAEDEFDWSPVVLRYEDAVARILAGFNGRTFAEEGPYELLEKCHSAAWLGQKSNFSQQKNLVKILKSACSYGYYSGHEQWHIHDSAKSVLKALAHFETGIFGQYPDGIADLLSEKGCLWFDLWELEDCKKLEKIRLFKNGRMDIRFTGEGYARQFVADYFGSVA